jgi:hypothetical protein
MQSTLDVMGGCGCEAFVVATSPLQFAKVGSAAALRQKEKSISADIQWGGFIPRVDVPSASSGRWPIASRQVRHRQRIFEQ